MNEVVAHLAATRLGAGARSTTSQLLPELEQHDPTVLQLSAAMAIEEALRPGPPHRARREGAGALWPVVKTGRTHLQDATPRTRLGQEFRAILLARSRKGCGGAGRPPRRSCCRCRLVADCRTRSTPTLVRPARVRHVPYGPACSETSNHFHAPVDLDVVIVAHGATKTIALSLWKIASDVRCSARGGIAEVALPETAPGRRRLPAR